MSPEENNENEQNNNKTNNNGDIIVKWKAPGKTWNIIQNLLQAIRAHS